MQVIAGLGKKWCMVPAKTQAANPADHIHKKTLAACPLCWKELMRFTIGEQSAQLNVVRKRARRDLNPGFPVFPRSPAPKADALILAGLRALGTICLRTIKSVPKIP